jgi:hypothetical protein
VQMTETGRLSALRREGLSPRALARRRAMEAG